MTARWFKARGYVLTDGYAHRPPAEQVWEIARSGSVGYGYITLRWMPISYGCWDAALVASGDHDHGINIGVVETLDQMQHIHEALMSSRFIIDLDRWNEIVRRSKAAS